MVSVWSEAVSGVGWRGECVEVVSGVRWSGECVSVWSEVVSCHAVEW